MNEGSCVFHVVIPLINNDDINDKFSSL